jgi:SdrD B-like protein
MAQEVRMAELREKSQKLMDGPLKHIRGAALAAALLPLASVVVAPASAQTVCSASGGLCGVVFNDLNHDGIQQSGEPGLPGVEVTINDGTSTFTVFTDQNGVYDAPGVTAGSTVTTSVVVPTGYQISPVPSSCLSICNDGVLTNGQSAATLVTVVFSSTNNSDFGFFQNAAANPGTATIGYWKTHPEAWPVSNITVGNVNYTVSQAIYWFNKVGKDKSTMMFAQLVAAMLSVQIGNDSSCVGPTIAAANAWLISYPVGSSVAGSSYAWSGGGNGATIEQTLDAYNNGLLCAPHRQ